MANNYLLFSEMLEFEDAKGAEWVEKKLQEANESDDAVCSFKREDAQLHVYSEEHCNMDMLLSILADYQDEFGDQKPMVISWAYTCSKPRISEFGGGAAVVVGGHVHSIDARTWADKEAKRLVPSGEVDPDRAHDSGCAKHATRAAECACSKADETEE